MWAGGLPKRRRTNATTLVVRRTSRPRPGTARARRDARDRRGCDLPLPALLEVVRRVPQAQPRPPDQLPAGRPRRQGQRGRGRPGQTDAQRDRVRRADLRRAEQAPLRRRPQPEREVRAGDIGERDRRGGGRRREDAGGLPRLDHRPGGRGCLSHRELHLAARSRPHQGRGEGRGHQEVPRLDAGRRAAAHRTAQLRAAAGVRGRARAEGAGDDPDRRVLATGRAALLSSPAVRLAPARARRPRRLGDPAFRALSLAFALSVLAIAGTIAVVLLRRSALARAAFGWSFLWTSTWDPVALRFGALPFIYGTLATTAIAIAIALPLGLGAAVCLAELMPRRLADPLTFLIELLVAVPSVIYGLVGVFVLVPAIRSVQQALEPVLGSIPLFAGPAYGVGLLTAGILLAVMIVPFIVSVLREGF